MKQGYNLELAPSCRAICIEQGCNKRIDKNTLRLRTYIGNFYGQEKYGFYCTKCAIYRLEKEIQTMNEILYKLRRSIE